MDWNNYTGSDEGGNPVKNGLKSLGRNAYSTGKRATKKGIKLGIRKLSNAGKKTGSLMHRILSPKGMLKLGVFVIIGILLISMVYSCNFYITGETDGQEGNYVDDDNTPVSEYSGSSNTNTNGNKNLSVSNAACLAYYTMLSKEKSCWQEKKDGNGKVTMIQCGSSDAVADAFGNDENYFVNPNLLYAMNKYLYPNDYVFPEAFLKPVAYEKDKNGKYVLKQLTDSEGNVVVTSNVYDEDGKKTDQQSKRVSDYGIGSVLIYQEVDKTNELKGKYIKEDYYDSSSGEVKQRDIDETFSVVIDSSKDNVISTAITFAGVIDFTYESDSALTTAIRDGESSSETDNVSKILYDTQTVTQYYATATGGSVKYFADTKSMEDFLKKNTTFSAVKTQNGKYKSISKKYSLYKYRSSDSGIYTNFVKKKDSKVRGENTQYLYDYLENFTTYKPIMTRTNDTFRNFDSSVTAGELTTVSLSENMTLGSGSNDFEMLYNGSKKKTIEEIWDGLINYGLSKEQTAAILGNITQESGFRTDAEDDTGAYGLCQFMNERKDKLFTFAKDYNKKTEPDLRSQIQFIAMEVLGGGKWADNPWKGHEDDQNTFNTSSSIDDITKAFCDGYERPAEWAANLSKRQKCARSAYQILGKRTVKPDKKIKVKNGVSDIAEKTSSNSGGLSEEEQAEYSHFYHMVDNIYDGRYILEDYYGGLKKEQADLVVKTANSYINGSTLTEESLKIDNQMWSKTYLSDLAEKDISISGEKKGKTDVFVAYKGEYVLPVSSRIITDDYGPRSSPTAGASTDHKGIDIAATYGEPVRAAKDGVVTVAEYGSSGGNYVIIDHGKDSNGNTIWTMYCHNSRLCVSVGEKVKQGQKIAEAGSTGVSTGVHCHLSVFKNGEYDNPHKYFDFSK